jgi:hypothetical protein
LPQRRDAPAVAFETQLHATPGFRRAHRARQAAERRHQRVGFGAPAVDRQVIGRDGFEMMRLVEDDGVEGPRMLPSEAASENNSAWFATTRSARRAVSRARVHRAGRLAAASASLTRLAPAGDLGSQARIEPGAECVQLACRVAQRPQQQLRQLEAAAAGGRLPRHTRERRAANVVGASQKLREAQPDAAAIGARDGAEIEAAPQLRQIAPDELVLQVAGVRRQEEAPAAGHGQEHSWQRVGDRLTGAGAGLDDELVLMQQNLEHRVRHLDLTRPRLEWQRLGRRCQACRCTKARSSKSCGGRSGQSNRATSRRAAARRGATSRTASTP